MSVETTTRLASLSAEGMACQVKYDFLVVYA